MTDLNNDLERQRLEKIIQTKEETERALTAKQKILSTQPNEQPTKVTSDSQMIGFTDYRELLLRQLIVEAHQGLICSQGNQLSSLVQEIVIAYLLARFTEGQQAAELKITEYLDELIMTCSILTNNIDYTRWDRITSDERLFPSLAMAAGIDLNAIPAERLMRYLISTTGFSTKAAIWTINNTEPNAPYVTLMAVFTEALQRLRADSAKVKKDCAEAAGFETVVSDLKLIASIISVAYLVNIACAPEDLVNDLPYSMSYSRDAERRIRILSRLLSISRAIFLLERKLTLRLIGNLLRTNFAALTLNKISARTGVNYPQVNEQILHDVDAICPENSIQAWFPFSEVITSVYAYNTVNVVYFPDSVYAALKFKQPGTVNYDRIFDRSLDSHLIEGAYRQPFERIYALVEEESLYSFILNLQAKCRTLLQGYEAEKIRVSRFEEQLYVKEDDFSIDDYCPKFEPPEKRTKFITILQPNIVASSVGNSIGALQDPGVVGRSLMIRRRTYGELWDLIDDITKGTAYSKIFKREEHIAPIFLNQGLQKKLTDRLTLFNSHVLPIDFLAGDIGVGDHSAFSALIFRQENRNSYEAIYWNLTDENDCGGAQCLAELFKFCGCILKFDQAPPNEAAAAERIREEKFIVIPPIYKRAYGYETNELAHKILNSGYIRNLRLIREYCFVEYDILPIPPYFDDLIDKEAMIGTNISKYLRHLQLCGRIPNVEQNESAGENAKQKSVKGWIRPAFYCAIPFQTQYGFGLFDLLKFHNAQIKGSLFLRRTKNTIDDAIFENLVKVEIIFTEDVLEPHAAVPHLGRSVEVDTTTLGLAAASALDSKIKNVL